MKGIFLIDLLIQIILERQIQFHIHHPLFIYIHCLFISISCKTKIVQLSPLISYNQPDQQIINCKQNQNQHKKMNQLLRQRIFPNKCIKLRPPTPHAPHQYLCPCFMCKKFQHNKQLQILTVQQRQYKQILQKKLKQQFVSSNCNCNTQSYEWLLSRLVLPSHKIILRGIDIFIPETFFYKQGEPIALFMNREIHDYRIKRVKKEKINQTYIQKILNQRRRKYRDQIQILTGQKVVQKKQSIFVKKQQKIDTKDAVIVQFSDKSEQLVTQNQLINLLLKRKQDPIWKTILMIKNFITSKQITKRLHKVSFQHKNHLYPQLFHRTKTLMLIYGGNITTQHKQYISEVEQQNFSRQLLKESMQVFAEYSVYKIVSYVEYFYDQRIDHLQCSILVNQFNRPYLVDVFNLQSQVLVQYTWTNQEYKNRIQAEQNKILINNNRELQLNPQTEQVSRLFQHSMYERYLAQKDKYGLTLDPQDTTQEQNNDKFFTFLHPEFKQNLSQVLRMDNISIADFKRIYLGHVPLRKPIFKPFTTNFVKTLHTLTPRVKFSQSKSLLNQTLNAGRTQTRTFRTRRIQTSLGTQKRFRSSKNSTINFHP